MGKIIAVSNQKGGVGKTTTSVNLAACLGMMDKKVLLLDLDPQGNSTLALGVDSDNEKYTVYNVILDECSAKEAIVRSMYDNLDLMPAMQELSIAEVKMAKIEGIKDKQNMLRNQMKAVKDDYDFIIIDCPPSLGFLNIVALTAADTVLIPIQCEFFALQGTLDLMRSIRTIQLSSNRELQVEGVLLTMYDSRNNMSKEVEEEVRKNFSKKVYHTLIKRNVTLIEASSVGQPVCRYDSRSAGCKDYMNLAKEVIKNNG